MKPSSLHPRPIVLGAVVFAAAAARLVPHLPNVTPIAALALFGGAQFSDRRAAFGVPLAAMLLSDLVIGFHRGMPAVYGCFAAVVLLGLLLRRKRSAAAIAAASVAGSVFFFVVTNIAVWAGGRLYAPTLDGLATCYVAALPFFRNELLGDLAYATLLFGGFALAEKRWPKLSAPALPA